MANLKETAKEYVPKTTKNIADLKEVGVDIEIFDDGKGTDNNGEDFFYSYIKVNEEEYRVPKTVLEQLKAHIENNPDLQKISVSKKGEGLKTTYTVIPVK